MIENELKTTTNPRNRREKKVSYNILPQDDNQEIKENEKLMMKRQEDMKKTNIFKSRIIDTDINSSLILQIVVYYQFYYTLMSFFIQFTSVAFKVYLIVKKIWVFFPYQYNIIKIVLLTCWLIIDLERCNRGFKGNIEENFPALSSFIIISLIFCLPLQISQILGEYIIPIDYACFIINVIFLLIEIILALRNMKKIVKKQASVYYLRNTSTKLISHEKRIKTSKDIEEELFYKFPHM